MLETGTKLHNGAIVIHAHQIADNCFVALCKYGNEFVVWSNVYFGHSMPEWFAENGRYPSPNNVGTDAFLKAVDVYEEYVEWSK